MPGANVKNQDPTAKLDQMLEGKGRVEELSSSSLDESEDDIESDEDDGSNVHGWLAVKAPKNVPSHFLHMPLLRDELITESSDAQAKVAKVCMDILSGQEQTIMEGNSHGIPRLQRQKHAKFLRATLGKYPHQFQAMDASRPWILYWALAGLSFLGEDVSKYRQRTIDTFMPMQNPIGGFGGGHGQQSHCAASYAATLSLALVDGLHIINRKTMWQFLGSMKQADGGFTVAMGGEMDIRGAYCSLVIINLLNLPITLPPVSPARINGDETFLTNMGEWFGRCQTFEGGIGAAPDNEAHGAYAFCCLAGLSLIDMPRRSIPRYLDVDNFASWLSSRQTAPEGGFSGRTNKLVDACYSHWVGTCWSMLQAAFQTRKCIWDRQGLVRYSLCCSQNKSGGMRDKPGTRPDGYHSCYSLAGLSAAQHVWTLDETSDEHYNDTATSRLDAAFRWRPRLPDSDDRKALAFDEEDQIEPVHPVFVLPTYAVDRARKQFEHVVGF